MGMAYCTSWCSQDREEKSNQIWKSIGIRICGVGWDLCHGSCKDSSGEERRTENRRKLHCGMVTLKMIGSSVVDSWTVVSLDLRVYGIKVLVGVNTDLYSLDVRYLGYK